jgi:hypothetical protein
MPVDGKGNYGRTYDGFFGGKSMLHASSLDTFSLPDYMFL